MGRVKVYVLELEQIKTGKFHRLPNAAAFNVCAWLCATKARIISGGRFHPEGCRLIRKLTSGLAG
jgi:hypothetical protein